MVSDEELVDRLREILRSSDLDKTTAGAVRRRLEHEFGVDLYSRRVFIRDHIDAFLDTHVAAEAGPQNGDVEEEEEDEEKSENEDEDENGNGGSHQEEEQEQEEDEDDEHEDEESDDDDDKKSKKKRSGKVEKDASRKGRGFGRPCALSPQLQEVVGEPELARTQVVKRIWEYIREKNLQNPKNKRKILCDETLRGIFRVNTIDMFQMNKVLSKHIWPLDEEEAVPVKSSGKEKQRKHSREALDEPKRKEKRRKGAGGFLAPLPISDALVKFFGTGEIELSRGDVVKRMWQYIKENELQDPSDKRRIICDNKLKELFDVDSFNGFTVSKLLTTHFIKTEG